MIRNLLDSDEQPEDAPESTGSIFTSGPEVTSLFELADDRPASRPTSSEHTPSTPEYTPPTTGQTIRMTGLAWSAGIALFGSIVFMLILGWFADLLLGSSPWGIVGGIVLGAIIGFIQFFRINSEILRTARGGKDGGSGGLL